MSLIALPPVILSSSSSNSTLPVSKISATVIFFSPFFFPDVFCPLFVVPFLADGLVLKMTTTVGFEDAGASTSEFDDLLPHVSSAVILELEGDFMVFDGALEPNIYPLLTFVELDLVEDEMNDGASPSEVDDLPPNMSSAVIPKLEDDVLAFDGALESEISEPVAGAVKRSSYAFTLFCISATKEIRNKIYIANKTQYCQ